MPAMDSPQPTASLDPASAATAILARNLAASGVIPDPAIGNFLRASESAMQQIASGANPPATQPDLNNAVISYSHDKAAEVIKLKTLKHIEIAAYILANRELSIRQVGDKFGVTPATITRIMGTDGFQYILAEEAKKLSTQYVGMRNSLENSLQAGALLAMERLIERIQNSNDTDQLLRIVSSFAELIGMGAKSGPSVQVNNFGVTGDHLRFATNAPRAALNNASPEPLTITG